MDTGISTKTFRQTGLYFLFGALIMLTGAIFYQLSGVDLDAALLNNEIEGYLSSMPDARTMIILNLTLWIIGAFLMGTAGYILSDLTTISPVASRVAKFCFITAVPLAIASFVCIFAVVMKIAPENSEQHVLLAEALGWLGSRADWIATTLIVGFGPYMLCRAGKGNWAPNWLYIWSMLCAVAAILTIIAIFAGGLTTYGFIIVPIGLGWMIATGITLLRKTGATEPVEPDTA